MAKPRDYLVVDRDLPPNDHTMHDLFTKILRNPSPIQEVARKKRESLTPERSLNLSKLVDRTQDPSQLSLEMSTLDCMRDSLRQSYIQTFKKE